MKRLIPAFFILFLFSCSKTETRERRAESLVKKYMETALDDPSSYEPLKFGKLDSIFEKYDFSPKHEQLEKEIYSLDSLESVISSEQAYDPQSNYFKLKAQSAKAEKEKVLLKRQDSIQASNFKGAFKNLVLTHEYRAKNKFGALIKTATNFTFNKDVTKIIDAH